jgi:hypothetical protein
MPLPVTDVSLIATLLAECEHAAVQVGKRDGSSLGIMELSCTMAAAEALLRHFNCL